VGERNKRGKKCLIDWYCSVVSEGRGVQRVWCGGKKIKSSEGLFHSTIGEGEQEKKNKQKRKNSKCADKKQNNSFAGAGRKSNC